MTLIKTNKMLETMGGNFISPERITLDERASAKISFTAFLALNEKHKEYPGQMVAQYVEKDDLKISIDSNNKLNV